MECLTVRAEQADDGVILLNYVCRGGQWRCHSRMTDVLHAWMTGMPWEERKKRGNLLWACYRAPVGEEPLADHLIDPKESSTRFKK